MVRKEDAVVYTTANRMTLAKIAVHMQSKGLNVKSMSEMLRTVLSTFETWIDKQGARPIETTHEATEILQNMFRASLNAGNRYKKSLLENMQQDEPEVDFTTIDNEVPRTNGIKDPVVERAYYEYAGIEPPKATKSPEEQAILNESIRKSQEQAEQSTKIEILPQLEIERNKAIAAATIEKINKYRSLARDAKSVKTKEGYELKVTQVAKYSQRASEGDNEALRILMDEL